jgi:hypothetical protein
MTAKLMIIRHAEKPSEDGSLQGVDVSGAQNKDELIVRGWQRAGALARFFDPVVAFAPASPLQTPKSLFASAAVHHSASLRPQHTIGPLSDLLGITVNTTYAMGDETSLAQAALAAPGPVLIAWHHEVIPQLANSVVGNATLCPQIWPGDRFDLVWVLDREAAGAAWVFTQVSQLLLSGDA